MNLKKSSHRRLACVFQLEKQAGEPPTLRFSTGFSSTHQVCLTGNVWSDRPVGAAVRDCLMLPELLDRGKLAHELTAARSRLSHSVETDSSVFRRLSNSRFVG